MHARRLAHTLRLVLLLLTVGTPAFAGPQWVFNEVLADPGRFNDSNGDGRFDAVGDEFIEIANLSGEDQDISEWTISDRVGVRHVFPADTIVPADCSIVVFGGGPIGRAFTGAVFQTASSGTVALNNGGDRIVLADVDGNRYAEFEYGAEANIDASLTRDPDLVGDFVPHAGAIGSGGATMSPGTRVDGDPFEGCPDDPPDPGDTGWTINEFLAAPPPAGGDANHDGVVDDGDEFVEIVNNSGVDVDISGWVLADGTTGRHQFLPGTLLADNCSVVVFGNVGADFPFNGASVQAASSETLDLDDDGDRISLSNETGDVLARVSYASEADAGGSLTRSPDVSGDFVEHAGVSDSLFSPGTFLNGGLFPGCPDEPVEPDPIEIFEIQGSGEFTSLEGETVFTADNIVTGLGGNGFFLQTPEERSDGDTETSDGIFVYTGSAPTVSVGDLVDVIGDVQEFFDWTELTNPRITVRDTGVELPEPVIFDESLPSPDQPQSPNELERFENMLIEFHDGTVTSTSDQYGNFLVVAGPERAFREPGLRFPGQPPIPVWNGNPHIFEVDPDAQGLTNVSPAAGTTIARCVGPLAYRFERYRVFPSALEIEEAYEPRPVRNRAGSAELLIGTQNLFRLVDDVDDPSTADEVVSFAEMQIRLEKHSRLIRNILGSPDIICLQEAENLLVLEALAARIAQDDPDLVYTAYLTDGTDPGGRNIGFLVRDSVEVDSVAPIGANATFLFEGRDRETFTRPPLVLRGSYIDHATPFPITVINVHLRSLLGIEDAADGPFVQAKRLAQAQFLADQAQRSQDQDPDVALLIGGDFNAFEFSDGYVDVIGIVSGTEQPGDSFFEGDSDVEPDLTVHVRNMEAGERYSTVFNGNAQAMDHVLTSDALSDRVVDAVFARGNSDAPRSFDGDPTTGLRSSDHDGLVVYVNVETVGGGDTFTRGDVNGDSRIDLSDGAYVFNFLFLGGDAPPCMAAADTNAAGRIELTSGIYLLNFLFIAGPPPPPPYPDCGETSRESDLALGCLSPHDCP